MTFRLNSTKLWKLAATALVMMGISFASLISIVSAVEPLPERPIAPIVESPPNGSKLVLKAPFGVETTSTGIIYDADDWTVVQWQAVNGVWYDVEGWQGTFSYDADLDPDYWRVEWWVGSENYGKENFRFVIYTNESRERVKKTSTVFDLPASRRITVEVTVAS